MEEQYLDIKRSATTALVLEVLFGLVGLPGAGWVYAGKLSTAIIVFTAYWISTAIQVYIMALTMGMIGCLPIVFNPTIVVISGIKVQRDVLRSGYRSSASRGLVIFSLAVFTFLILAGSIVYVLLRYG